MYLNLKKKSKDSDINPANDADCQQLSALLEKMIVPADWLRVFTVLKQMKFRKK
jgi:hypothetical protein